MPRNQNGVYFLPDGNPVLPGELIKSEWANTTLDDVASALTESLDRKGQGGMTGPLKAADGTAYKPSITFTNEPDIGFYRSADGVISITFKGAKLADLRSGLFQLMPSQRMFLAMNPTEKFEAATKEYADMLARKLTEVVGVFGPPKTPADLPPNGVIPANFFAPNQPPAPFQVQVGQSLFYTPNNHAFIYVSSSFTPLGWVDAGEVTGEMGPQGPQGIQGEQGPAGAKGDPGETGPTGPTGPEGPKGDQGPVGPEGAQGKQGSPGQTAVLVGYFKNRKPSELPPNGFIPANWDGPGNPAIDEQLRQGEALIYTGGLKTDEAYGHVWSFVTTDFTAAGWVDCGDIEGPEGPMGADGAKGDQGETGPVGPTGPQGPKGDQGATGPQGVQGIQGPTGPEGPKGDTGSQGPQGPGGPQGPAGPSDWNAIPNIPALVYNNGGSYNINASSSNATALVNNDAANMKFQWSDPGGQPTYIWGSNGPGQANVYNVRNFSVHYADSAYSSETTGNLGAAVGLSYLWTGSQHFAGGILSTTYSLGTNETIYFADSKILFAMESTNKMWIGIDGTFLISGGTAFKPGGGTWTDSSDSRIKADIAPLQGALSKLMQLRPVEYELLTSDASGQTAGFIAQEVREVFPDAVSEREPDKAEKKFIPEGENILCIGWKNDFFAYIVGAIQDLSRQNEALQVEVEILKGLKK